MLAELVTTGYSFTSRKIDTAKRSVDDRPSDGLQEASGRRGQRGDDVADIFSQQFHLILWISLLSLTHMRSDMPVWLLYVILLVPVALLYVPDNRPRNERMRG